MEDNRILTVIDSNGNEISMEILFTFENEDQTKKYVLYTNPQDEEGEVFASRYDEEGNLYPIETEEEWAMVEEVFGAYSNEFEVEEA